MDVLYLFKDTENIGQRRQDIPFSDWFRKQQMAGKTHLQSVGAFSKLGDARFCSHHLMSIHTDLVFNVIWFSEVLIVIVE